MLTGAEARQQHDRTVGKFQSIVMRIRAFQIHLPKAGDRAGELPRPSARQPAGKWTPVCRWFIKRELRAGQQAHGHRWLTDAGKALGDSIGEFGCQ